MCKIVSEKKKLKSEVASRSRIRDYTSQQNVKTSEFRKFENIALNIVETAQIIKKPVTLPKILQRKEKV